MRTRKARQLLRRGLVASKIRGHQPAHLSSSGAVTLYGCMRKGCNAILECWDNPDNVAGSMVHTNCSHKKLGWIRRQLLKLMAP
mgnify:CR=1 FL=1